MKMKLKHLNKEKIFNKKNVYLGLLTLVLIGLVLGVVFYLKMSNKDKITVNNNISSYFNYINTIKKYNFLNELKTSLINNLSIIIFIWLLGLSVIGIIIVLFILYLKSFSLGFSISSIISSYGLKGILGVITYIFPDKLLYLLILSIEVLWSVIFSYRLFANLFLKKDYNLKDMMKKYSKLLIIFIILGIVISLVEVFISPFIIKLFTFLIN